MKNTAFLTMIKSALFGNITLEERIGKSINSDVYRGRTDAGMFFAVKKHCLTESAVEMALLERAASKELRRVWSDPHPLVVPYEHCDENGKSVAIMPYVKGATLQVIFDYLDFFSADLAKERNLVALALTVQVGIGISQALVKLHTQLYGSSLALQRFVYSDMKPQNVLLDEKGCILLADFGTLEEEFETCSEGHCVKGTPFYFSPEQAQRISYDHKSDIFSAGIVLYELLTGIHPFADSAKDIEWDVMQRITSDNPCSLLHLNPTVPRGVEEIITLALSKQSSNRPSAEHMLEQFLQLREKIPFFIEPSIIGSVVGKIRKLLKRDEQNNSYLSVLS
ncbi:MAG: serine/threonine-protein kinase [Candidatus Woesearchaeota archaeon]|nr:serine/threonine-protein kinase [Candidatus Woesearchaeota archaeon]